MFFDPRVAPCFKRAISIAKGWIANAGDYTAPELRVD